MMVGASSVVAVSHERDNEKVQFRRSNPYWMIEPWVTIGLGRMKASAARNPGLLESWGMDCDSWEMDGICRAIFKLFGVIFEFSAFIRLSENVGELGSREEVDWFNDS